MRGPGVRGGNGLSDSPPRFDVIEIMPGGIYHIPGAFDAGEW